MKKLVVVLGLFLSMASYAEEQSNVINAVSSVVSGVVSTGKDVLKGVKEGIDTGRKEGTSIDNASIEDVRNFGSKDIIGASNPGLYHDHENNQYQHETQIS